MDQGYNNQETQWPHYQCTGLRVEKSESETWLSVIVLHSWVRHVVSQYLSYPFVPRGTNGWGGERGEGVKFAMD